MSVTGAQRAEELLGQLRSLADPVNVAGMAHFGISAEGTLGVSVAQVRVMARALKREAGRGGGAWRHEVALALWESGVHEARMLAGIIDDPTLVTPQQMEQQVADLDSWDLCDGLMINLYRCTPYAYETAITWTGRAEEFVKRAGFVLMATLAVHEKAWTDERFLALLPIIEREATDPRTMVKKAVNWALRQIGKRSVTLLPSALALAERLSASGDATARWIGKDAARELRLR
ncbi:MAG: DNA alkylation repair protein [Actinobacteria bacterium]|nr:MAG: DNA alkylation repair protein [Actinomycetota bacterium]